MPEQGKAFSRKDAKAAKNDEAQKDYCLNSSRTRIFLRALRLCETFKVFVFLFGPF
jgi:hypothetical protein